MKGFIVFEIAPPCRLLKFEKAGPLRRVLFLWFSITVCGWKWTDFISGLIETSQEEEREKHVTK